MSDGSTTHVYVQLLDEGVEAWRPVLAEHEHDNVYRIIEQPYDRQIESWEFEPGDSVICEVVDSNEGKMLAATSRSEL